MALYGTLNRDHATFGISIDDELQADCSGYAPVP